MLFGPNTRYPVDQLFSRQQLQQITGIPDDVLGYWFKEELLVSEPAEGRKHRRFRFYQAHVAVVLEAMRSLGANIGVLRSFAGAMQRGWDLAAGRTPDQLQATSALAWQLNAFRRGENVKILPAEYWNSAETSEYETVAATSEAEIEAAAIADPEHGFDLTPHVEFARSLSDEDIWALRMCIDLAGRENVSERHPYMILTWLAWLNEDGHPRILSGEGGNLSAMTEDTPPAGFFLSFSRLIRPLWVGPEQDAADRAKYRASELERWGE